MLRWSWVILATFLVSGLSACSGAPTNPLSTVQPQSNLFEGGTCNPIQEVLQQMQEKAGGAAVNA